jgi:ATP diphosphatase
VSAPGSELERLVEIMARLRAEGGCPWDREQDLRSLRPYLVEEAYEVLDEMDGIAAGGPWRPLAEELGDLLFQIVFHAQLARELGEFDMADVCRSISDKIVRRHPHVFGERKVSGAREVLANWAELKAAERKEKTGREGSVLEGVPRDAPALLRAERLTEKASRIGFDWPDLSGVRAKLAEELTELDEAIASKDRDALEHELGDVLFSLANLARFLATPAEDALRQAIHRFVARFHQVEAGLKEAQVPFGRATLPQMEALWQKAKAREASVPAPRAATRVPLATLVLPVPSLAQAREFWAKVAPLLAWLELPTKGLRFSDGGTTYSFEESPERAPVQVRLQAPSQVVVEALAEALKQQGVSAEHAPTEDLLTFTAPGGHRVQVSPQPL